MAQPTSTTKRYLRIFLLRLAIFLTVALCRLWTPERLDFISGPPFAFPLLLLWLGVLCSMLVQLSPKSKLTAGCLKQYPSICEIIPDYDPVQLRQAIRAQNHGALKVAALWLAINLWFGALYHRGMVTLPTLVFLCALAYLCDLVCVLFFCPFQTFLMKNRCCVNCRIFAWGSWMMAAPLMWVPHWYSQSLFWTGVLVLACWEVRFHRHPERFWRGSNRRLQCAACREQLCQYKHPRSR